MRGGRMIIAALTMATAIVSGTSADSWSPVKTAPLAIEDWTVAKQGVAARFYRSARPRGAAVLLLVGSEGGFAPDELARSLAEAGHPVLALAYFSGMGPELPKVPKRLEAIPLEYFDLALDRLATVTHRPLAVVGESRGAEAALLIASRRRDVRAAVAFAPTSTVWQSPGTGGNRPLKPAWTVNGTPVAYAVDVGKPGRSSAADFAEALGTSAPNTVIPVERIRARTLLVAGLDDQIWPSAKMAKDIAARMRRAGNNPTLALYPAAGHLLMGPGPGEIRIVTPDFSIEFGGTELGNLTARNAGWGQTLKLLAQVR